MKCEICECPIDRPTWVRPKKGGKRAAHFFCDEACKSVGLRVLDAQGLVETHALLGWDVFIPMHERE